MLTIALVCGAGAGYLFSVLVAVVGAISQSGETWEEKRNLKEWREREGIGYKSARQRKREDRISNTILCTYGIVLLAVLAMASLAHSEDMFILENRADGITLITDEPCKRGDFITKATNRGGSVVLWGCTRYVTSDLARVRWSNGHESYFNLNHSVLTDAGIERIIDKSSDYA